MKDLRDRLPLFTGGTADRAGIAKALARARRASLLDSKMLRPPKPPCAMWAATVGIAVLDRYSLDAAQRRSRTTAASTCSATTPAWSPGPSRKRPPGWRWVMANLWAR
jgi:hypothetical protein